MRPIVLIGGYLLPLGMSTPKHENMNDNKQIPPAPSRPLDVHRWSDHLERTDFLNHLIKEVEGREVRQRARAGEPAKRLRSALRSIVLDLFVAWKTNPELEIGIPLSSGAYNNNSRYRAVFLRYDSMKTAYQALRELGYLEEVRPGFHDPRTGIGRTTRAKATDKLISVLTEQSDLSISKIGYRTGPETTEVIVLRDENKNAIPYEDTPETIAMRTDLARINALLENTWIDLYLSNAEFSQMQAVMRSRAERDGESYAGLDLSRRQMVRIFNNGSWEQGGRFYGPWWQSIPSSYRKYITIGGKPTVEVDYSGMHVALLYAQKGVPLEGDAYDIGLPYIPRNLIKLTFNKLLNASGRIRVDRNYSEQEYRLSWSDLLERIRARHSQISDYIGTGYGIRLQAVDARIANQIMLRFLDMDYACLPVHDSFIVHNDLKDELEHIMVQEFAKVAGREIVTKDKFSFMNGFVPEGATETNMADDIGEYFSGNGPYSEYEQRQLDWLS